MLLLVPHAGVLSIGPAPTRRPTNTSYRMQTVQGWVTLLHVPQAGGSTVLRRRYGLERAQAALRAGLQWRRWDWACKERAVAGHPRCLRAEREDIMAGVHAGSSAQLD